jgi:hypothetical protein
MVTPLRYGQTVKPFLELRSLEVEATLLEDPIYSE